MTDGEEEASQPEQQELETQRRFQELCSSLNMDERAKTEAWDTYQSMSKNYTLEGDDLHWLVCALYVACRKSVPTISKGTVEGNYVSLTRILRCSEQSLIDFFNKMKKWEEMANLPTEFRERTEKLERNFTVSAVIFKKYEPIFQDMFKHPPEDPPRPHRGRKQRRHPCTVPELFNFCWVLFVHAKGNFPMISDDLVNSYHLLLCALDLVYGNALQCPNRKDLLNPNFRGLPEDFHSKDYKPTSDPLCIIEKLCTLQDGILLEAKGIKEHFWKPFIRKLFEKKILKGKEENLSGFLDPGTFGDSLKSINKVYEEYVLSVGNLDERIFLGDDAGQEIGTLARHLGGVSGMDTSERAQMNHSFQQHFDRLESLRISTPLTGRDYIREGNPYVTPVSSATQSVSRLHSMLAGLRNAPSAKLLPHLRTGSKDFSQPISERLNEMREIFCEHTPSDGEENGYSREITSRHFRLGEVLYYKVLETVIEQERKRLGDSDLSGILEQDVFHRSLMSCCLEIVTFSYKPPGNFPSIIELFDVPPYHFYKVIEVVIRAEEGLCREVVKHLNGIEEQILDHMAWKTNSPLWNRICDNDNNVPTCEEVMPPHYFEEQSGSIVADSPFTPRRVNTIRAETGALGRTSPTTLLDRYSSPVAGTTRRRLFVDKDTTSDPATPVQIAQAPVVNTVPVQNISGQTLLTMATATVTANNGQTVTIPVQGIANENGGITFFPVQVNLSGPPQAMTSTIQPLTAQSLTGSMTTQQMQVAGQVSVQQIAASPEQQPKQQTNRPKKASSLALFLRKVYHLASIRLRDLCQKLDIADELMKKIWTCFEFSLVHCTEMMKDRHLDQLLMCAVYVMSKVKYYFLKFRKK